MNEQELKNSEPTALFFEFRTFGHNFTKYQEKMAKLSVPIPDDLRVRIFNEIYIIFNSIDDINIKVKNNKLDIKKLIHSYENLEQWDTIMKQDFPISKQILIDEIFPVFKADIPIIENDVLDKKQFISIVKRQKNLLAVPVQKQRHAYIVNLAICEFVEIIIDNDYLYSVSVKSMDVKEVTKAVSELELDSFENINYVQAIKRVKDIISKPLAN